MFTGLISDVGIVRRVVPNVTGLELEIETRLAPQVNVHDSVCTNGVCLTVTQSSEDTFTAQAVFVTLAKSNLSELSVGDQVNCELAMSLSDRLGGHLVQGHVNTTTELLSIDQKGENFELLFATPPELSALILREGSIALDGISLTVAKVHESCFGVSIIPYTWDHTNLSNLTIGKRVNVEVDIIAKYIQNLLKPYMNQDNHGPTLS